MMAGPALSAAVLAIDEVLAYLTISERETEAVRHLVGLDPPLTGVAADWARDVAAFRNRGKYDYVCAVVLLYGALEHFIEEATSEYLVALTSAVTKYAELPEKLRNAHFNMFVAHMQRTRDARYDGVATAAQLASAFSSCLLGGAYEFIEESMLHHTANFRPPVVDEFLGRVGVDSASRVAVASEPFEAYLLRIGGVAPSDRPEAALDLVTDLVIRRNQVAHGDISNALAPSELVRYCDQIKAYCQGIAVAFESSLLSGLVENYGTDHGNPIAVFNNNIVCVNSRGAVISTGDRLAIKSADGKWYSTEVVSIQIDGKDVDSTRAGDDVAVGLKIDARCKEGYLVKSGVLNLSPNPSLPVAGKVRSAEVIATSTSLRESLRERMDEAKAWLDKNGEGSQGAWLRADYERCCELFDKAKSVG